MTDVNQLITEHLEIWTSAIEKKSGAGRGIGRKVSLYGIKKLRALILELAVRGKLVPQNVDEGMAENLLKALNKSKLALVATKQIKKPRSFGESETKARHPVPDNWAWVRLDAVGAVVGGGTPSADDPSNFDEPGQGFPWLTPADLSRFSDVYIERGARDLSEKGLASSSATPMPQNTILFTSRAPIGYVAISVGPISTNQGFKSVIPYEPAMARYIALVLRCFAPEIDAAAPGTTFKEVSGKIVAGVPFPLPPLAEQHRIVAKVDELMGLCDTLESQAEDSLKAHQTLVETCLAALTNSQTPEDLAQNWARLEAHFGALFTTEESIKSLSEAILEWAVRGLLSETSAADTDPSEFLQSNLIARSELQKETGDARLKKCANTLFEEYRAPLPASWSAASFDELFLFIDYRGRTPKKTGNGTPLITAKNVRMGQLNREPREYVSDSTYVEWMTRGFPRIGDLFFTTEAPLANVCINDIDEPFALAQRVICLQPISQINTKYIEIAIRSKPVQEMIDRNGTGMTAKGIKASKLKPLAIPFPPIEEQDRIVDKVQQLDAICDSLASSLKQAENTKLNLADGLVRRASEIAA